MDAYCNETCAEKTFVKLYLVISDIKEEQTTFYLTQYSELDSSGSVKKLT